MSNQYNIVIKKGADFSLEASMVDPDTGDSFDSTDYTSKAQLRRSFEANTGYDFETTLSSNSLIMTMSANTTSQIEPGRYVYDVYIYSNTDIKCILEGLATVNGQVTRP